MTSLPGAAFYFPRTLCLIDLDTPAPFLAALAGQSDPGRTLYEVRMDLIGIRLKRQLDGTGKEP